MMNHEAIYKLNPSVVTIRGDVAYDANNNVVEYDKAAVEAYVQANAYKELRAREYPPVTDWLDGMVKGDQAQMDAYVAACQAVKNKYPKS